MTMTERIARIAAPVATGILLLLAWQVLSGVKIGRLSLIPAPLDVAETGVPPLVFAMCEGPSALEVLGRWERRGVRVINGTRAIVNTHRERSLRLLAEHGVPVPESR